MRYIYTVLFLFTTAVEVKSEILVCHTIQRPDWICGSCLPQTRRRKRSRIKTADWASGDNARGSREGSQRDGRRLIELTGLLPLQQLKGRSTAAHVAA